jgi:hypothetical protein
MKLKAIKDHVYKNPVKMGELFEATTIHAERLVRRGDAEYYIEKEAKEPITTKEEKSVNKSK